MNFTQLLDIVADRPLFESSLLIAGDVDPVDISSQLSRWVTSGRLIKLRRGLYAVAEPFASRRPHPFEVANALVSPSYVSGEYALGWYGIIPEALFTVTSVTTGRGGTYDTPFGRYVYQHIRSGYLWGYDRVALTSGPVALQPHGYVASPEKALLDLLYFRRSVDDRALLEGLRLDLTDRLDAGRLLEMSRKAKQPRLERAARIVSDMADEQREEYLELDAGDDA